jgi:hypothetical protein
MTLVLRFRSSCAAMVYKMHISFEMVMGIAKGSP